MDSFFHHSLLLMLLFHPFKTEGSTVFCASDQLKVVGVGALAVLVHAGAAAHGSKVLAEYII